jgi:hypothetical protein
MAGVIYVILFRNGRCEMLDYSIRPQIDSNQSAAISDTPFRFRFSMASNECCIGEESVISAPPCPSPAAISSAPCNYQMCDFGCLAAVAYLQRSMR